MSAIAVAYPEEVRAIRDGITSFIKTQVIPLHEKHAEFLEDSRQKYTAEGRFSEKLLDLMREIRVKSAEAGYFNMSVPESLGGSGLGYLAYFAAWEQLFHLCGTRYWLAPEMISHWAKGPSAVLANLTPAMRAEILDEIVAGKKTICFALSEPEAGSDAAAIKTRATRADNGWVINGEKIWVTNSPYADYLVVFAVTEPDLAAKRKGGISAFIVPSEAVGFRVDRLIKMFGEPYANEALLHFDSVRVEDHQLLGELHQGFQTAMLGAATGRIYNVARCVGMCRWALETAFEYVKVRKTFGKSLSERQGVTFPLVECATQVHAAHLMSINVAQLLDQGHRAAKELAMAKAFCGEVGPRTLNCVIQTHGAMGFTNEMQLFEAYISMRKIGMADGSIEIMRRLISKRMLDGDVEL